MRYYMNWLNVKENSLYQASVLSSVLLSLSFIQIIFMIILMRQGPQRGGREVVYVILCITLYTVGTAFEYMGKNLQQIMFWTHVQYIGLSWISFFLVHFVVIYFDIRLKRKVLTYSVMTLLSTLSMIMQFTYNLHSLFYTNVAFNQVGNIAYLTFTPQFFYVVIKVYQVVAVILVYFFSAHMLLNPRNIYKKRALMIMSATLFPVIANIVYVLPIYRQRIDFIPFSFLFTGVILLSSYYNDNLFGPLPVAKRVVVESLSDGIIILDKHDNLIDYNSTSLEFIPLLASFKLGEPVQKLFREISWYKPLSNSKFFGSGTWDIIIQKSDEGNRYSYYEVRVIPISQGAIRGTSLLIRDVSEQYILQEALHTSFNKLVELDNLKTMIIEVMSHDLRSPLITMKSLRRLLASGTIAKNPVIWKRTGDELDSLIDRADSLIFNLISLSGSFGTSSPLSIQPCALESIIDDIEPVIMRYAKKKEVSYQKLIEEDVLVLGEVDYVRAICRNILENAIKYSPNGGVVQLRVDIEKDKALLIILDEGDGIKDHVLTAFNEDRWGVTTMGSMGEKGPGIGLYATKRFVKAIGGTINIKKNKPIGTVVEIAILRAIGGTHI